MDLLGDCRIIDSRAPLTLDALEDKNNGGFPLILTTSVAAVVLAEDGKPGWRWLGSLKGADTLV